MRRPTYTVMSNEKLAKWLGAASLIRGTQACEKCSLK